MIYVTHQHVDEGTDDDGPEAASEGVGEEGSDDRGEAGSAGEVGENVGGLDKREVQDLS